MAVSHSHLISMKMLAEGGSVVVAERTSGGVWNKEIALYVENEAPMIWDLPRAPPMKVSPYFAEIINEIRTLKYLNHEKHYAAEAHIKMKK